MSCWDNHRRGDQRRADGAVGPVYANYVLFIDRNPCSA